MDFATFHVQRISRSRQLFSFACHWSHGSRHRIRSHPCFFATTRDPLQKGQLRPFGQSPRWTQRSSASNHKTHLQPIRGADSVDSIEPVKPETLREPRAPAANQAPDTDGLLSEQTVSNKEQRKADWAIIKEMAQYLWPKVGPRAWNHCDTLSDVWQGRYGDQSSSWHGVGLARWLKGVLSFSQSLVDRCSKTGQVLNIQVPFYFRSIVDSMNVDFTAVAGTAWTVGGSMIIACTDALCCLGKTY